MASKNSLFTKILGFFGFKPPKKASTKVKYTDKYSASSRNGSHRVRKPSTDEAPLLDDNFEIVSSVPKSKKKKKRTVLKVLLSGFLIFVITVCVVVGSFMIYVFKFVDGTVEQDLDNLKLDYTSIVYAQNGKNSNGEPNYVELTRLHSTEDRLWVDLDTMPGFVKYSFISAEDKRFESHEGVDWKRTFSAFANLIFHFYDTEQGGSTITQQLVKNLTDDSETKVTRKIREIMRARYLESMYSKDTIIECYLNTIHLGNGVDGVEVASNYYFDKNVADISLTQAACLAALTKSPSGYDPYEYPEDNKARRNWVLSEMYNNGYITKEECQKAQEADLGLRKTPSTVLSTTKTVEQKVNSYFVDAVIEDVISGLMEQKKYSYEYAESQLYKGGFKIYTTVDLKAQKKLEDVFTDEDNFATVYTKSGKKAQASMTIMDYSGHIVAIVGGRGEKTGNRVLNRAIQSPRQTGSSIKPVTCYAPAIESNIITWASKMVDGPVSRLESGELVSSWPKNYSGYYSGTVSITYALQQSLNTIPVKLVQEMGLKNSFEFATKRLGISTLYESIKVDGSTKTDLGESSLALGGSVYGVTTKELTAAYVPFGNLGTYHKPTTYLSVYDQYDNIVLSTEEFSKRAMSEETANIMCELLQTVTTNGTGSPAAFGSWPIMSKTGTTTGTKDRWFVGGTPYYMAAVWFGMDNNEEMNIYGINPALRLWRAAMRSVHEDLKLKDFPQSDAVEYRKYCVDSGMIATSGCTNTRYGYFKTSYQPLCDIHGGSAIDAAEKPAQAGQKTTSSQSETKRTTATTKKVSTTKATERKTQAATEPPTAAPTEPPTAAPTVPEPTQKHTQ